MLFYKSFGNVSKKHPFPIIFLHGFLGSYLDWTEIIDLLHKEYECIAIDLPAHGKSSYSKHLLSELEDTLKKWPQAILVGYSLGGRLCLGYGQKHPKKVKGMIALSAHLGIASEELKSQRLQNDMLWKHKLQTLPSKEFLSLWYEQKVFASLQKRPKLLEHLLNIRTYHNGEELASILDQVSLARQPFYQNFAHPLAFLYGEDDIFYAELYKKWPISEKKSIACAGHPAHLENPGECAEAIAFFAEKYSL